MIGKLLSTATQVVTTPIDITEVVVDCAIGGNGGRDKLKDTLPVVPSEVRDKICDVFEDIDK